METQVCHVMLSQRLPRGCSTRSHFSEVLDLSTVFIPLLVTVRLHNVFMLYKTDMICVEFDVGIH